MESLFWVEVTWSSSDGGMWVNLRPVFLEVDWHVHLGGKDQSQSHRLGGHEAARVCEKGTRKGLGADRATPEPQNARRALLEPALAPQHARKVRLTSLVQNSSAWQLVLPHGF